MSAQHSAAQREPDRFDAKRRHRARVGAAFHVIFFLATLAGLVVLAILIGDILHDGARRLSLTFLKNLPSRLPARAGIYPALMGSVWVLVLTAVVSFPLGVGTAIWLEEYAPDNRVKRIIQANIANLAGVPSIVYGILGLSTFVYALNMGRSILAAALTLSLLILPVIIIASQEALKAVPNSIRLGAYALGATRWETVRHHVIPQALPGILTAGILALSRAVGEAAPLLLVGALAFVPFAPKHVTDQFTVIPVQIYAWVDQPREEFQQLAAAAGIVLLALLLSMNAVAIFLRNRYSRKG